MTTDNKFKKTAAATAVAAVLATIAGAALAQSAPAEDNRMLEVIVTAQRVAQPASKTPLSLSVVSGDDLKQAGAVNASSLTELVPNVQVSNNGGATTISIRGVSSADNTEKGDPSASFNVDGVNLARPQSAGLAFYDLERVEVLRGPQGTLYGRNATAGAINLITNKPSDKFEGSAAIELGNYHSVKLDGMLNVKVNELLALRAAVSTSKHDGYMFSTQGLKRNYDDDDSKSARLHGLFKFSPDISLLVTADTSTLKGAGAGTVPYQTFATRSGDAQRTSTPSIQGYMDDSAHGTSGELKINTRVGEITYQLARRTLDRDEDNPFGQAVPGVLNGHTRVLASYSQLSHELRLASSFGAWKTIAGLYWFKEQSELDVRILNFPGLGVLAFIQNPTISKSKAGFGEATYSVTPKLNLIAGLRRTNDDKSRQGYSQYGNPVTFSSVNDASVSYAQTTGRVGADYALSKSTMLYTTLSTGYKAGGFNDGTMQTNRFLRYDPEKLTALEIGVKGRFLDNRLQVNADVFGYNYKDLQLTGVAIDPATGALATQTLNAGKARVTGLEVEGKYAVGSAGKINFSATTLDAHFTSYSPQQGVNWAGKRLEKSPRVTFGLGYSHVFNFEDGASLTAYAGTRFSSSYVLNDYGNAKQYTQDRFHKSDINLNYSPSNYRWSLQAYVRNIEDKTVMTSYAAPSGNRPDTVSLAPPRTIGARVSVNF